MQIIPAILEKNFKQIEEKIKLCEGIFNLIQIDICDGNFVPYVTWQKADDLKKISASFDFEVHLMVRNPEKVVKQWFSPKIKRIIFHIEAQGDYLTTLSLIKNANLQAGIAINPETSLEKIKNIPEELIDEILFLGVTPGRQGQKFQSTVFTKIKKFQETFPETFPGIKGIKPCVAVTRSEAKKYRFSASLNRSAIKIGVDGGVNDKVAKKLKNLPIDYLVIGSYFWRNLTDHSAELQKEKLKQLFRRMA